jgi:cytochrome P450
MNLPVLVVLFVLLSYPIRKLLTLRANLKTARRSGLRYVVCPAFAYYVPWIICGQLVIPLLRRLPTQWQGQWLDLIEPEWFWKQAYAPYQKDGVGADNFLIVTPEVNHFVTADPAVINQLTTRRVEFPKPIKMYKGIEIYGTNVVTCEGQTWRRHRKNTAPPFGEKNNKVVWKESLFQASQMVRQWTKANPKSKQSWGSLVSGLSHDTMRLSLYVISRAGFGVRCEWPGAEASSGEEDVMSANEIPKGHSMSYVDSLETLLQRMLALFLLPASSMSAYQSLQNRG